MGSERLIRLRERFYSYFEHLKKIADYRFDDKIMAEAAFNYALEDVSKNGWERLQAFRGDIDSPQIYSFLRTVFSRCFTNYERTIIGRHRGEPSKEKIKKLGEPNRSGLYWEVFLSLCRRKDPIDLIILKICTGLNDRTCPEKVNQAAEKILSIYPECGRQFRYKEHLPLDNAKIRTNLRYRSNPEDELQGRQELNEISCLLKELGISFEDDYLTQMTMNQWKEFRDRLDMTQEEQLFLRVLAELVPERDDYHRLISLVGRSLNYDSDESHQLINGLRKKILALLKSSGFLPDFLKKKVTPKKKSRFNRLRN